LKTRRPWTIIAAIAVCVAMTACQSDGAQDPDGANAPTESTTPSTPSQTPSDSQSPTPAPTDQQSDDPTEETDMRIDITIEGETFGATLDDSAASRDLVAQLPVEVEMSDHGGVEKTGPLPSALSLEGKPPGADPDIGDVGYYAPGNDFVLYYGDQSYFAGIVVIGQMDDGVAERIAGMDGDVTARLSQSGA
jgi:hypothetical protein